MTTEIELPDAVQIDVSERPLMTGRRLPCQLQYQGNQLLLTNGDRIEEARRSASDRWDGSLIQPRQLQ